MGCRIMWRVSLPVGIALGVFFSMLALGAHLKPAAAQPLGVSRNYPGVAPCNTSLQACIDGSAAGDVINIAVGTYFTSVTLNKAVSLIGAGVADTVLSGIGTDRIITVTALMDSSTIIANMTLLSGNAGAGNGGAIFLAAGAQPLLTNLLILSNQARSGGGIYASSSITLENVTLNNNAATNGSGGGIYVGANLIASNSTIQNNSVITNGYGGGALVAGAFVGNNVNFMNNQILHGFDGGGLYASGAITVWNGQFTNNGTNPGKGYGGGGGLMAFGRAVISGTFFSANKSADWGGGAYLAYFANAAPSVLTNVQFLSNTAAFGGGGGLFMWFDSRIVSSTFANNWSSYRGGGLYAGYAGSFTETIIGSNFMSNSALGGGGLYGDGSLAISAAQFISNTARNGNGGGVWALGSAQVTDAVFTLNTVITGGNSGGLDTGGSVGITNTIFSHNRTVNGSGGGSGAGGDAVLNNVQYLSNTAANIGGGMLTYGAARITNSRFENNRAPGNWGGGVFANTGATIANTLFISNVSSYAGGGFATYGVSTFTGGRFERNLSINTGWGGGIYSAGSQLVLSGTQFLSNTAQGPGGGLVGNTLFLTSALFVNNSAVTWGGGAQSFGPTEVYSSAFTNNRSQGNGGGISTANSIHISRSVFSNNATQGDGVFGGGAVAASGAITARSSSFTGNTANTAPGGALAASGSMVLVDSNFSANTAGTGNGGAVATSGSMTLDRITFTNNQAGGYGGAIMLSGTLVMSNSQLINNFSTTGGGLYQGGGDGRIVNSLFARNLASNGGMQMYLAPTGTLQMAFVTAVGASPVSGDAIRVASGNVSIQNTIVASHTFGLYRTGVANAFEDYNLFYNVTTPRFGVFTGSTHDLSGNAAFVNPAADNYRLRQGSAAIDTGTDVGVYTDFDGQLRPQLTGYDIGYDELKVYSAYAPMIQK